jgi:hypothetical protein
MRGVIGMGPQRHKANADNPDATIKELSIDVDIDQRMYLPFDPLRQRVLMMAFPNGTKNSDAVRKIAEHFKDTVKYYEPRNEPNFGSSGAAFVTRPRGNGRARCSTTSCNTTKTASGRRWSASSNRLGRSRSTRRRRGPRLTVSTATAGFSSTASPRSKTGRIRLLVHDVTWGGGATQAVSKAGGQTGPHQIMLREVELYGR